MIFREKKSEKQAFKSTKPWKGSHALIPPSFSYYLFGRVDNHYSVVSHAKKPAKPAKWKHQYNAVRVATAEPTYLAVNYFRTFFVKNLILGTKVKRATS